MILKIDTW